jgi:hypothetical protein
MRLKQVKRYPETNSVEATWIDEKEDNVKCKSYADVQMTELRADLGADASEYNELISTVEANIGTIVPPIIPPANSQPPSYRTKITLASDIATSGNSNTMLDVTGLSFPVTAGKVYHFEIMVYYTSAASSIGSRWAITGPANPTAVCYTSEYSLTNTTTTRNARVIAYDSPSACNASSSSTHNMATLYGFVQLSVDGTVTVRFASESSTQAITAKAGSTLEWWT